MVNKNELHKQLVEEAAKSPCKRRKVGCIIAKPHGDDDYTILSEGYNYHPDGESCELDDGKTDPKVIHAEVAAVLNMPLNTSDAFRSTCIAFVTHPPCENCRDALYKAGITRIEVVGEFLKFDSEKPRLALVPTGIIWGIAKVVTYGAKKYKVDNWRNAPDIERYISAMMRHLFQWLGGEEIDKVEDGGSGERHIDMVATNLAFIIDLYHLPRKKAD